MLSISPPRFARPTSTMNAIGGNRRGTKPRRVSCPSGVHLGTGSATNNNSLRPPSFQSGTHRTRSSTISATSAMDSKDFAEDDGRGDTWWCGCSSETAETMAANLPHEIHNFNRNVRYMRRLVKDTRQTLADIRESGSFYRDQLSTANVNADQLIEIGRSLEKRPCFVVHGQNCFAKSIVVNELLGKQILPPATFTASTTTAHGHDAAESMSTSSEAMAAAAVSEGETHVGWRMVRFRHGTSNQISLSLPDSYELMEHLQAFEQPAWRTVPSADLELQDSVGRKVDPAKENAVLDIRLSHPLLKEEAELIVTSSTFSKHQSQQQQQLANDDTARTCALSTVFAACSDVHMLPILIYAISEETLSEAEQEDLKVTRSLHPDVPVFFICVRQPPSTDLTESEQHAQSERQKQSHRMIHQHTRQFKRIQTVPEGALDLFQQLCDLGFLNLVPSDWSKRPRRRSEGTAVVTSELVENFDYFPSVLFFVRQIVQSCLVSAASVLHQVHNTCLKMFINAAFDMARDLLITPKRIEYAKRKESELYEALLEIANEKQEEIKNLIVETIDGTKEELVRKAADYEFRGVTLASDGVVSSARELRICTSEIQDLVLGSLNSSVAVKLIGSVECLRESVVGTLERCLESLEKIFQEGGDSPEASNALKHVRRTQRMNTDFCRPLNPRTDLPSSSATRFCHLNFQQILTAAYQVEVTVKTSSSLMRVFWEKMKQLIQTMPGKTPPHIDSEWKQRVASDMIDSLSEWRLAKSICSQFRERLKHAHEAFNSSLRQLEAHHSGRLEKTEEQRLKVRKIYAPKIARYALESTSLRDFVLHGMPQLGREIGRGQYGVVFSCESWGHQSPCALKSVVPPDEKHWNDLALEFHYTRSVPEHDRIVTYIGSVIDHTYAGGSTPAVILIMERLQRDLYSAIRSGLDWLVRLQIAVDVIQGIRFLHSQGLVHRDIKLKNVLLDKRNRAKLTDLGFCKPEAMMSGSIVGTPIHMAPELFCGKYDHRVDVYAFGILFWYICAGHVRLPYIYEQCQNKDQLWNDVKRGVRPERLPQFDDKCWAIMEECWATEKDRRPLLGEVELRLNSIINYYRRHPAPKYDFRQREVGLLSSSPYIDIDF